jgi:hypothetical protein
MIVAALAAALAVFATGRAREAMRHDRAAGDADASGVPWAFEQARLESLPEMAGPLPRRAFWIGAWVGPPPGADDAATWRRYAAAGLDLALAPLEDRYRRADNAARLALLDTLGVGGGGAGVESLFAVVRDDSLHPDETTRPGWEGRVDALVRAHAGSRALAGILLADEPAAESLPQWAPLARRLGRLDPARPPWVNFAGLSYADAAAGAGRARWREEVVRAVREARLAHFTVDVYPFRPEAETANFLVTLRETARVSHATRRPFGFVLQWTGHGPLKVPTAEEASYLAMQALGHGATGLVWFTYWTPDPAEEPWRWRGGAIEYDGRVSARFDTLAALNRLVRRVAAWRGSRPMLVVHAGDGLPRGFVEERGRTAPGIASITGGPVSLAFAGLEPDGSRRYLLIDRARTPGRRIRLTFDPPIAALEVARFTGSVPPERIGRVPGRPLVLETAIEPGGAVGIVARPVRPNVKGSSS